MLIMNLIMGTCSYTKLDNTVKYLGESAPIPTMNLKVNCQTSEIDEEEEVEIPDLSPLLSLTNPPS